MSRRPRASLYVRLSRMASGDNVSRDGMVEGLRALCRREDFREVAAHVDDGKSGAIRNRPEFLAWIADARAGRADVLLTWHADRLSREGLNVAATLLDVVEGKHPETGKEGHTPAVRLMDVNGLDSNDGDSFRLRFVIQAEVARAERERIRHRVRSAQVSLAAAHRFAGGPTPYGYRSAPNPNGPGRVLEVDPEEAAFIRVAAEHVLAGQSLYSALRLIHDAGSRPRRAPAWALKSLGIVLTGDPVLGRLTRKGAPLLGEDGKPVTPWAPILTADEVEQLRASLRASPLKQPRRRASRLLSGLLLCASCGGRMRVNIGGAKGKKQIRYACHGRSDGRGCDAPTYVICDRIEAHLTERYLDQYGDTPYVRREVLAVEPGSLADVERELRDVASAMTADDADVVALAQRLAALKAERQRLRNEPARPTTRLVYTGKTHREVWEAAEVAERRAMLAAVYVRIRVSRGGRGRHAFDASRLHILTAGPGVFEQLDPHTFRQHAPTTPDTFDDTAANAQAAWDAREAAAEDAGGAVRDAYATAMRGEDTARVRELGAAFAAGPEAWAVYVAEANGAPAL